MRRSPRHTHIPDLIFLVRKGNENVWVIPPVLLARRLSLISKGVGVIRHIVFSISTRRYVQTFQVRLREIDKLLTRVVECDDAVCAQAVGNQTTAEGGVPVLATTIPGQGGREGCEEVVD